MSKQSGRGRVAGLPEWDRCAVMGVVNVTPDSFSDGGRWFDTTAAVKHGLTLVEEGADLVDVGGESTRPGATRVDEAEELQRVVPVVRGLAAEGVTVSVDTMRARVAEEALAAGAVLVNDVSGGLADPAMIPVVADAGAPFVVMHWRGFLEGGNVKGVYADVVAEVVDELHARVDAVLAGGISPDRVVVDPGLGFSKTTLPPSSLLERAHAVEEAFNRVRDERWGPRTLDVDIVAYAEVVSDDPVLTLPHPRAHERAFVLAPWHDVEPEAQLPGRGPVAALLDSVTRDGVEARKDLELRLPE
ncbi:dihydropteroate synthase [Streptomyces shaanxiensis]